LGINLLRIDHRKGDPSAFFFPVVVMKSRGCGDRMPDMSVADVRRLVAE
jgi:hypothetical protein